ncbi:MAG: PilZ domain-containing protein [Candidatus Omnitrophota bacterium]|nr:PilZ domain-containing protein [Candidatus Omnitrophota bacterium]
MVSEGGPDRRKFMRLDYRAPLAYKVCSEETINKLLQGYTADISQSGLLCNIKDRVNQDDILWLSFDRSQLNIFEEIERRSLIYQNGIIGKVVRIEQRNDDTYNVGVQFITREEKNLTNIYPRFHFVEKQLEGESKQ